MERLKIAIIGGTGVYENVFLEEPQEMIVETSYGKALFCRGYYKEREIYFLARHGAGHGVPPHLVNYRANIAALKKLHIDAVISTAAVGSMRQGMPPGSRVVIDQFIDFTKGRPSTFYEGGGGGVVHVDPVSYTHLDVYKRQDHTCGDHINFVITLALQRKVH